MNQIQIKNKIIFDFFKMGTKQSSQQIKQIFLIQKQRPNRLIENKFDQTDVEMKQQCDNPSYGKILCLNIQPISASNNILSNQQQSDTKKSNKIIKNSKNKQNIENLFKNSQNRSIQITNTDHSFFSKIPEGKSGEWAGIFHQPQAETNPIASISKFIMDKKSLFDTYSKPQIKNQDFIKLKKVPIRKYYKFQNKIGQGAYGNVYKAKCIKTRQVRAVKSVKHKMMSQDKQKEFISQIQILRQLDHPNIVKLFEVYQQKSKYHVVTQYCVGGSLIDFVTNKKKYSEKVIRTIFEQLLSALNYMHSLGIVHRDLKLQNLVFLKSVNQKSQTHEFDIKIIDFGTAKKLQKRIGTCKNLVGTTSYMAPEIIDSYFSEKSDLWSAGVILYILMIGKSPFKCTVKQQTLRKIKNHQLQFSEAQWQNYSPILMDLLKKMLVKEPSKRISASEALRHGWFNQLKSGKNLLLQNKNLVDNLSKYYRGNNLISKIQSYLTFIKINQQERKEISQLFRSLDKDYDGTIGIQELKQIYLQINKDNQQILNQIQFVLSKIDKNKSGKIDLAQFTAAIYDRRKLFVREYLEQAFDYFDINGTGYLERNQFQQLMEGCQKQQIEEILADLDLNLDKKISKQEFLQYLLKKNYLYRSDKK